MHARFESLVRELSDHGITVVVSGGTPALRRPPTMPVSVFAEVAPHATAAFLVSATGHPVPPSEELPGATAPRGWKPPEQETRRQRMRRWYRENWRTELVYTDQLPPD